MLTKFMISLSVAFGGPYSRAATGPTTAEIKVAFDQIKTADVATILRGASVGGALRLIEAVASTEDAREIRSALTNAGVKMTDRLPESRVSRRGLTFAGDPKAYDLDRLASRGEVYDGRAYWRFASADGWANNYRKLISYLGRADKTSARFSFALPEARADEKDPFEPAEMRKNQGTAAKTVLHGLYVLATIGLVKIVIGSFNLNGFASAAFLGTYAGVVAFAAVLFAIVDSLGVAIDRYRKSGSVECVDGRVQVRVGDRIDVIDSKLRDLKFSNSKDIGVAELKVRQLLCEHPEILAKLNRTFGKSAPASAADADAKSTS